MSFMDEVVDPTINIKASHGEKGSKLPRKTISFDNQLFQREKD
jgi:hypothetical protein